MAIRRTTFASSLVVLAALIPLAGCGHTATTGASTAATSTPSASAGSASTPSPSASPGTAGCASVRLTITNADNNKTLCVTTGTIISVFLHGTASNKWTPIHSDSIAVMARFDPSMTLQVGVTGASFDAASPGTSTITSARNAGHFRVTLDIRYRGVMGR
jgi:hypothetical protein